MSLRDSIFAKDDIPSESVDIPEWDVTLEVRGMTGADRTRLLESAVNTKTGEVDLKVIYPDVVILCTYDPEDGLRVFEDGDRDALMSKSANAIDRLANAGMRLSGFENKEGRDAAAAAFPEEAS